MTESERSGGRSHTPQSSATIYSSLAVHGVKYRDFSASRREARALLRERELARKPQEQVPAPGKSAVETEAQHRAKAHAGSHWFALQGIFAPSGQVTDAGSSVRRLEHLVPAVAVFSIAGGVGKTSVVATLGRVLAAYGEHVLLAETAPLGLLPEGVNQFV